MTEKKDNYPELQFKIWGDEDYIKAKSRIYDSNVGFKDILVEMKYNEDEFLREALNHIKATYGEHYVADKDKIQLIDYWGAMGNADTTCRDTAIKYICRYGKKGGNNRKDLFKAIHYISLMDYFSNKEGKEEK